MSKPYKCHTGASRYPAALEIGYLLAVRLAAGFRVKPGMTGFMVFPGWINRSVSVEEGK
jgi:hypothetical protein